MALKKKENNSLPSPPPNSDVLINDDMVCDECYGHAHCTHCLARIDDFDSWRNKNWKEDAARDWNDRTYPPEVQAAVERDKPKKPDLKTENKMSFYVCESCGNKVFKGMNVCDECGQRLNWED